MSILRLAPTVFGVVGGVVLWPTSVPLAIGVGILGVIGSALGGSSSDNLDLLIQRCKLGIDDTYSRVIAHEQNDIGTKYRLTIPTGMSIKHFISKQEEIQQYMGSDVIITLENGYAVIQTITKQFKDKYSIDLTKQVNIPMQFVVGADRTGNHIRLDLTGTDTHTLIVGTTGSGKSVAINLLIVQMIRAGLEIALIDLKAVEFVLYQDYKYLQGFAIDEQEANEVLQDTLDEMNRRYDVLLQARCKNYTDYNKRYPKTPIKPRVVVIDEFQSLIDDKDSKKLLFLLLSKARASNIIIILSCQSPRHEIVDGRLRDNIRNYLIFKCETPKASEVATGTQGDYRACKLAGNGRGLLKSKGEYTEFQGYYLSDQEIEDYIKPYNAPRRPQERIQDTKSNVVPMPTQKPIERIVEPKSNIDVDRIDRLL